MSDIQQLPCGHEVAKHELIGVQIQGVYDGVLFWQCPVCPRHLHRFPEGHPLRERAEQYVRGDSKR